MTTVLLAASFKLDSLVVVMVAAPTPSVTMDNTYLVGALAAVPAVFCSQPQVFAAGSALLEMV